MLGLKEKDFVELTKSEFLIQFNLILERASNTAHITAEQVEVIIWPLLILKKLFTTQDNQQSIL